MGCDAVDSQAVKILQERFDNALHGNSRTVKQPVVIQVEEEEDRLNDNNIKDDDGFGDMSQRLRGPTIASKINHGISEGEADCFQNITTITI